MTQLFLIKILILVQNRKYLLFRIFFCFSNNFPGSLYLFSTAW